MLKRVMGEFGRMSGQKVNLSKTKVFFSKNVGATRRNELSGSLGVVVTDDLGKYLGVPLLHKRVNKDTYSYIVEKVSSKLSSWKAERLSFAGRLTLVSSVAMSIPIYSLQSVVLPSGVCEQVKRKCRDFLWGSNEEKRKTDLVSWRKVCLPKKQGAWVLDM